MTSDLVVDLHNSLVSRIVSHSHVSNHSTTGSYWLEAAFFYRFPSPGLVGISMCLALDDQLLNYAWLWYESYQAQLLGLTNISWSHPIIFRTKTVFVREWVSHWVSMETLGCLAHFSKSQSCGGDGMAQLIPRDKMRLRVWVGGLWAKSFLFLKFTFLGPLFFGGRFFCYKCTIPTRDITKPTWRHLLPEKGRFIMRMGGLRDLRVVVEE